MYFSHCLYFYIYSIGFTYPCTSNYANEFYLVKPPPNLRFYVDNMYCYVIHYLYLHFNCEMAFYLHILYYSYKYIPFYNLVVPRELNLLCGVYSQKTFFIWCQKNAEISLFPSIYIFISNFQYNLFIELYTDKLITMAVQSEYD